MIDLWPSLFSARVFPFPHEPSYLPQLDGRLIQSVAPRPAGSYIGFRIVRNVAGRVQHEVDLSIAWCGRRLCVVPLPCALDPSSSLQTQMAHLCEISFAVDSF